MSLKIKIKTPEPPTFINGANTKREDDYARFIWSTLREADAEGINLTKISSKLIDKNPTKQRIIYCTYRHYWFMRRIHNAFMPEAIRESGVLASLSDILNENKD